MDKAEIESWLWGARRSVLERLDLGAGWWPMTNTTGHTNRQAEASGWALAFFIQASLSRCVGASLTAACNTEKKEEQAFRTKLLSALWIAEGRTHSQHEVLVDFSVHNWAASNPVQLTGESECYPSHGVGDSMQAPDDYSWDFYKLLVIPSTTRLFFARVAGHGGDSAETRVEKLAATLTGLIDWYAPALLRHHDELGAVIIPASKGATAETRILWLERGRLRHERVAIVPDLAQEERDADA